MSRKETRIPDRQSGFTILELLVLIAVLGILLAITLPVLSGWQSKTRTEGFVTDFASEVAAARAVSLSTGSPRRIIVDSDRAYRVQQQSGVAWADVANNITLNAAFDLSNAPARCLVFDTRGFMRAYAAVSCLTDTTNTVYTVIGGGSTRQLQLTALGLVNRS